MIKKYLVPHKDNNYTPHIFKTEIASAFVSLVILFEIAFLFFNFLIIPSSSITSTVVLSSLFNLVNEARVDSVEGLSTLNLNDKLQEAAELKALDMAQRGYFSHIDPDGKDPWIWLDKVGYKYKFAGENLALNFTDTEETIDAWLQSEYHRKNILNPHYYDSGVGMARGEFEGKPAIFLVQFFGSESIGGAVLGLSNSSGSPGAEKSGLFREIFSSPRTVMNVAYSAIAFIILFTLVITVIHRNSLIKKELVLNGLLLVVALFAVVIINQYPRGEVGQVPVDNLTSSVILSS